MIGVPVTAVAQPDGRGDGPDADPGAAQDRVDAGLDLGLRIAVDDRDPAPLACGGREQLRHHPQPRRLELSHDEGDQQRGDERHLDGAGPPTTACPLLRKRMLRLLETASRLGRRPDGSIRAFTSSNPRSRSSRPRPSAAKPGAESPGSNEPRVTPGHPPAPRCRAGARADPACVPDLGPSNSSCDRPARSEGGLTGTPFEMSAWKLPRSGPAS